MNYVKETYDYVFFYRADPRLNDWLFMTSPWPLTIILLTYLSNIKLVIPFYMRNRQPCSLKFVIKWYNILQIVLNSTVSWGLLTSGWTTTYSFWCPLPDYSMDPEALRMLKFLWWTTVIKFLELLETYFFVIRKKDNQASFLHVYHHITSAILIWVVVKYYGGGIMSFPPLVNNSVHVVMYTYYLLSSEGSPRLKAYLIKYKKWMTTIQMIQFGIIILYLSIHSFIPGCTLPSKFGMIFVPHIMYLYYMFSDFFKKNYTTKQKYNQNGHTLN